MTSKYLPMFPEAWDDGSGTSCTNATWNVSSHDDVGGGGGEPLPSCADDSNSVDDETSSADMGADADTDTDARRLRAPRSRASFSRLNRHVPSSSASANFWWQSGRLGRSRPAKTSAE